MSPSRALNLTFEAHAELSRRLASQARSCSLFRQADLTFEAFERLGELLQDRVTAESLVIVLEGELRVTVDGFTFCLGPGESLGARYLIEPEPQREHLEGPARVLSLDGAAFDQFAREFPECAFRLQNVLARSVLHELKKTRENLRLVFQTLKSVG